MRLTHAPYDFVAEGLVAGAKDIGMARNGSLQNRVVVRIADNGYRRHRRFHHNGSGLQVEKVPLDGLLCQGPPGLNVRIGQHAPHFNQNCGREDQRVRPRDGCQKKVTGKTLR